MVITALTSTLEPAVLSRSEVFVATEIDIASHSPSALAAAAIICGVDETQDLAIVGPTIAASWFAGLTEVTDSNGS